MAMHPSLSGRSFPFFWRVSIAEAPKRPRPPGGHHHRLEVDVAGEALGNWATVPRIMVDLAAVHWAARDEIFKRLLGKRSRVPLTVVTGLFFLGSVNAKQVHELRAEPHGIAIYYLKSRLRRRQNGVVVTG
jgi:hypothetical protein